MDEELGYNGWHCHRCNMRGYAETEQATRDALDAHERNRHQLPVEEVSKEQQIVDVALRKVGESPAKSLLPGDVPRPLMTNAEIIEALNRHNHLLQDARIFLDPKVESLAVGPQVRWHCDTCGLGGSCDTEKLAFDAERAHYATVEHDRATETKLRLDVRLALAGVETARVALYDYLKSKNRAA